ncbi:MAG: transposase [Nitrospirae bacterium]|nr:transposase [Nitrospirota bacterium]MBI5096344.1 transposase [Nitrospirota bacterium]
MRKRYPPSLKAKVALEAIKEQKTSAELASLYQVHPGQIRNWKAVVLKGLVDLFSDRRKGKEGRDPTAHGNHQADTRSGDNSAPDRT